MNPRPHAIPAVLVAALLLLATFDLPYGFYTFLRIVVLGTAVYVSYYAYKWHKPWVVWLFALVAVLFNPVVPVHLDKEVWFSIDIVCAALFMTVALVLRPPHRDHTEMAD